MYKLLQKTNTKPTNIAQSADQGLGGLAGKRVSERATYLSIQVSQLGSLGVLNWKPIAREAKTQIGRSKVRLGELDGAIWLGCR